MKQTRRQILTQCGIAAFSPAITPFLAAAENKGEKHPIATNTYPWTTFAHRDKHDLKLHSDAFLSNIAATGIIGYEPIINSPRDFEGLGKRLKAHGLNMRSIYVNSVLHDATRVDESIASVISIAKEAKKLGTKIVVTNPSPIRWAGPEDKTDSQLRLQARSLNKLGSNLKQLDVDLAYHNHDAELRNGGREFHHMLTSTDPENVKFCLDAHWIYRGCGNSEVAVFNTLALYHHRIVELHLRQSASGVWSETFKLKGDINYSRLFDYLADKSISPHLVLEQAVEEGSPKSLSAVDAHRQSQLNVQKAFS